MKTERELIAEISRIGREAQSLGEAVELAQSLLAGELGESALLIDSDEQGISPWAVKCASAFLDSREFPFRGLYIAPLTAGNKAAGRLIACFGSFGSPGAFLQNLTAHIAGQFGPLLARTQREVLPRPEAA